MAASRRTYRDLFTGLLWISPWLVGFFGLLVIPALYSIRYSFCDYSLLDAPAWVGLENYRELAGDRRFYTAVTNTLIYAAGSVIGCTLISLLLAVLLEKNVRGAALVRAVLFVPTLVPVVSACVVWGWMLNEKFGLINGILGAIGLSGPDWLGNSRWAMPSLIIMSFWSIGTSLIVASAALKEVPGTLYDAADIDGMGTFARLWHVTLPMISPAVLFNALMSIIWSLQVFAPAQILTRGGPGDATVSYSMYVYANAFIYGRMGYACALAWVQTLVIFTLAGGVMLIGRKLVYYRAA